MPRSTGFLRVGTHPQINQSAFLMCFTCCLPRMLVKKKKHSGRADMFRRNTRGAIPVNIVHAAQRDEKGRRKDSPQTRRNVGVWRCAVTYMRRQCPGSQPTDMHICNFTTLVHFSPSVILFPFDAIIRPTFTRESTSWVNLTFRGIRRKRRRRPSAKNIVFRSYSGKKKPVKNIASICLRFIL